MENGDPRNGSPVKHVLVFVGAVNAVPWLLYFLLRSEAERGATWATILWLWPTVWAPAVVGLFVAVWTEGGRGARQLVLRLRPGQPYKWLGVTAVAPIVATFAAVLVARQVGDAAPFVPLLRIPSLILLQLFAGAIGEELGWRGFLLPRLRRRLGDGAAAWATALLWSAWHASAFFFPGAPQQLIPPVPYFVTAVFAGVFFAVAFTRTGGSVLTPVMGHVSMNLSVTLGGVQSSSMMFWWSLAAAYGMIALSAHAGTRATADRSSAAS